MKSTYRIVVSLLLAATAAACGPTRSQSASNTPHHRADPAAEPAGASAPNIVELAAAAGTFKTLVAAVQAAGLVEALSGPGPFTVFAPTDEAFAKLPAGTVDALLADKAKLATILKYHVVLGAVGSSQIAQMTDALTLEGRPLRFDASSGVRINNATVVKADIEASNGLIHVIDTVLIPQ